MITFYHRRIQLMVLQVKLQLYFYNISYSQVQLTSGHISDGLGKNLHVLEKTKVRRRQIDSKIQDFTILAINQGRQ